MPLADQIAFLRSLGSAPAPRSAPSRLVETASFGADPGQLRMLSYVPPQASGTALPLAVALHGCGQTAAGFDLGAGWSALADRYGFALLMPEQRSANNAHGCFNWFSPDDVSRDRGEVGSIRSMIAQMESDHAIDDRRIFAVGLSAGGAMTAALLATYPDLFAAGAVIAGTPYGVATTMQQALTQMYHPAALPGAALGDLARHAAGHAGLSPVSWPRLAVWHGGADRIVHPDNADALVRQWCDVHGLSPSMPSVSGTLDGYPTREWHGRDGSIAIAAVDVTAMGHGVPLGYCPAGERYGTPGPFLIDAGVSASYHIVDFFGLTRPRRPLCHVAKRVLSAVGLAR